MSILFPGQSADPFRKKQRRAVGEAEFEIGEFAALKSVRVLEPG